MYSGFVRIVSILVLSLALVGCPTITVGTDTVTVPDLVGLTQSEAVAAIAEVGSLSLGTVTEEFSDTVPLGQVISQNPLANTSAATGSSILLVVSKGVEPVVVPDVVGQSRAAAESAIDSAGLTVGTVVEEFSDTVPDGQVISQDPPANTTSTSDSTVSLVVSKGPEPVSVPDLLGMTQSAAESTITAAGLVVGTVSEAFSASVPTGQVISQDPVAATNVAPGSAVDVVISKGVEPVLVPTVDGMTQEAATSAITAVGLTVGTVTEEFSDTVPSGQVISQDPIGGSSVAPSSAVALVISKGVEPVSVPNVVGMTQASATSTLMAAGLMLGTVSQSFSATAPEGQVLGQDPAAGSSVAPNSAVSLDVSKGPAPVTVPNVVGMTQSAAASALVNVGLTVGTVTQQASTMVPAGQVISQNPAGNTSVARGTTVNLVVSEGGVDPGQLPGAAFSARQISGEIPLDVAFVNESVGGASAITEYSWDFGDGGSSVEPAPSYRYEAAGTYTVSLEVTNAFGSDTETKTNYAVAIEVVAAPTAPTEYPVTAETEFNDNPVQANVIADACPFRIEGAIQQDIDGDYFRFAATAGDVVTAALGTSAVDFEPSLSFADSFGSTLQSIKVNTEGNGQYATAISTIVANDGDIYIVVNDLTSSGDPDFTYTIDVFKDSDSDGLSDDRETAYESNPAKSDSDGDGIIDSTEFYVYDTQDRWRPDFDGDGDYNWNDRDSDSDGLPDLVDGTGDADLDTLANFTDFDSDANGMDDRVEAGFDLNAPRDIDLDSTPDFLDKDNDGDAIWDLFDPALNDRNGSVDLLDADEALALLSSSVDFGNGETLDGVARAGDLLILSGRGFAALPEDNVVLFRQGAESLNVYPAAANESELQVEVPGNGLIPDQVAVLSGGILSNWLSLRVVSDSNPVLFQFQDSSGGVGGTLTLYGLNLADTTLVNFGGVQANAFPINDGAIDVTIPAMAQSGSLSVVSASGVSNSVPFKVTVDVDGQVDLPSNKIALEDLSVNWGVFGEGTLALNGSISAMAVNNSGMDSVFVLLPETVDFPQTMLFQAITLPSDVSISIGVESTAVALTMTGIQIQQVVALSSLEAARTLISNLTEVHQLANAIESALNVDSYFLGHPDEVYEQALISAAIAADAAIAQALSDGALEPTKAISDIDDLVIALEKALDPFITGKQSDIGVERIDDSGFVEVVNDTQLYLSARFVDTQTGVELVSHISSYFDQEMIEPQDFGLLFLAGRKKYNGQKYEKLEYRDFNIEIVTPGIASPSSNPIVAQYLARKTVVARVVLPLFNQVIGDDALDADLLTKIIAAHGNRVFENFGVLLSGGDPKGAMALLFDILLDDAISVGPITKALAKEFGTNLAEAALEKLAKKIGAKLVPGLGTISLAIDLIQAGNTFGTVLQTRDDLRDTPGDLEFEVRWPLEVTDVAPTVIRAELEDKVISIYGQGFAPFTTGFGFWEEVHGPQVRFTDVGYGDSITVSPSSNMIATDGTQMTATLPASWVVSVFGPIDVTVIHGGQEVQSPVQIRVVTELEITSLEPNQGGAGSVVTIHGAGFNPDRFQNRVTFEGSNGSRLVASTVSVSSTSITVVAPQGVETGPVQVEAYGEISNSLVFEVVDLEVIIDFGDNGSANDDTYAVFVDGLLIHSMPQPTRNAGPFYLDLGEGFHAVTLRGITAPDAIGTYFISFGGNVVGVTGDSLTGSDLTAGVEKHYVIEVGALKRGGPPVMNTVPPGILWAE